MSVITQRLRSSSTLYSRIAIASLLTLGMVQQAEATEDPTVVSGDVRFNQNDPRHLIIQQLTQRGIIDWRSFNIAADEWVEFQQPGANSVTLNRIIGGDPTEILGRLTANGNIMIVNPNGILFGAGSQVDVAGLVATTADITNDNFNAGNYKFDIPGRANASVINRGTIRAADKGLVALVAPGVENSGIITARAGTVQLGSAQSFTVDMYGDGLYSFELGKKTNAVPVDENGKPLDAAVNNSGTISAQGGAIHLTANAASEVLTNAVNNTGVLEATSMHSEGGVIVLGGGEGNVRVAGKVNASGKGAGQKGGKIKITGKHIDIVNAEIDASGAAGGGEVLIGGEQQGGGAMQRASTVNVDKNSSINVSALENGDGGTAIIWSDDHTTFNGSITANGGATAGNGGLIETSSAGVLTFDGQVDVLAAAGKAGTWLIDPTNLVIGNAMAGVISGQLTGGANVTATTTAGPGPDAGDIILNGNIISGGSGNLTFDSFNDIILNGIIDLALGALNLDAGNDIVINNDVTSFGGLTLNAGNDINVNSAFVRSIFADVNVVAGGDFKMSGGSALASLLSGEVFVTTAGDITLLGNSSIFGPSGVNIDNSGTFFSDSPDVLISFFGDVNLNQTAGGSIQNAIDAIGLSFSGQTTLNLASGIWNENVNIDLANFTLSGNGFLNSKIRANGAPAAVIDVNANNVTVQNLGVDGLNNAVNGINGDLTNNLTISGVDVLRSTSHGIEINNANNFAIANSRSRFTGGSGIYIFNGNDFGLTGNQMFFNGSHGIEIAFSSLFDLIDNRMSNMNGDAINVTDSQQFLIDGTNLRFTGGRGIAVDNSEKFAISNGFLRDTGASAIEISDSKEFDITGNFFQKAGGDGINVTGSSFFSIADNEMKQLDNHGIKVHDSFLFDIARNIVSSTGLDAINVTFSSFFELINNRTFLTGRDAINISDRSNNFVLFDNFMSHTTRHGIHIDGDAFAFDIDRSNIRFTGERGINIEDARDFTITNSLIQDTGTESIAVTNGEDFTINNNRIDESGADSVQITDSSLFSIFSNLITDSNGDGVQITGSNNFGVVGNRINRGTGFGILVDDTSDYSLFDNTISWTDLGGISVANGNNADLQFNKIFYVGGNAITANNITGGVIVDNRMSFTGADAINVTNSDGINISANNMRFIPGRGIVVRDSDGVIANGNFIRDIAGNGIDIANANGFTLQRNLIERALNGINLQDVANGLVGGPLLANANKIFDSAVGIFGQNVNNTIIANNRVETSDIGINVVSSDGLNFASNRLTNNGTGVLVENSDNVNFLGDTFISNLTGLELNDSDGAFLDSLTFTDNNIGLFINNGSGGALVTNTNFSGGNTGVLIDGAGSDMQFQGNSSSFASMSFYFRLQNGAMVGGTLDASQQTFDGVVANTFTPGQLFAAEAITTDVEDGIPTIGDVFYTAFPAGPGPAPFTASALDQFQQRRNDAFPDGLFSFSGQTLTNDITQNNFNFRPQQVQLSLLGQGEGAPPPALPAGTDFANLTPQQLANLSPAAGGENSADPDQLAALSPSAGGSCGNSYLGVGYDVNFSAESCRVVEQQ